MRRPWLYLVWILAILPAIGFGQDCYIVSKANDINPDRLCSPVQVVTWEISYVGVNHAGTSVEIHIDWDDGDTEIIPATELNGTISEWVKKEGEPVEEGMPLFVVETDKAAVEVNASATGILLKILVDEGESAEVDEKVAVIGEPGEDFLALIQESDEQEPEEQKGEPEKPQPSRPALSRRIKASPAAKRLAREQGIDLSQVAGSGEGGSHGFSFCNGLGAGGRDRAGQARTHL